ncbi:MAG: hypothetical protein JWR69_2633 [Pedosphaera sp.]|nr:hypothetical protein [Pedosphaera sp.]
MRNTKNIVITLSLLAAAATFIANLPELRRYLKIRSM